MKMPKRFTSEQTTYVNVGGSLLPLNVLPEELAGEYAMLDAMRKDLAQRLYDLEVINLAVSRKNEELTRRVLKFLEGKATAPDSSEQTSDK